ncbi:Major Facilitator Superfamily protein [Quadrisphaera granulorum]|uniref:MFS transporter n=1 Tax=Quadrisphaera granulorum TaxID=317664 RepID=A0A316AH85_9ACTN|nr:MFS transporter [Quadrisphaera granulorum]PWJ56274.1 MFS transporter [Quadrisphaera granulorum]SZE94908.1 Major Facilitator Superfamily protein [Quadrisphaera granulorum]
MIRGELRVALAGIVSLVTLVAFEAMAVSTAMPVVADELGGLRRYGLAFSLFLTASLLGTVLAGGWADARGPRAPVVAGLVAFAGGLVLCGTAPTFTALLAGRAVSGLGGGLLVVSLYAVVGAVFDEAVRPRVFAWISSAWVLPAVVGPLVAGWLATAWSWRAVFLLVAPLALVVGAVLLPRLWHLGAPAPEAGAPQRTGLLSQRNRALRGFGVAAGAGVAQAGAAALVPLRALPVVSVLVGVAVVVVALPALLPAGTLRADRGLPSVVAVRGLMTAGFMGAEAYVPLMLVLERGMPVTLAGLALTGAAMGWTLGSALQGRQGLRIDRSRLMALGGLLVATSVGLLVLPSLHLLPGLAVLGVWAVGGLGMGLTLSSTSVLTLSMSPPDLRGRHSAALQLSDALGAVIGIGVAGAVFAARLGAAPDLHGGLSGLGSGVPGAGVSSDGGVTFALVFGGLSLVGLLAAVVALRVRPAGGWPDPPAVGSGAASVAGS